MDQREALDKAGDDFLRLLRGVTDDQWDRPTPCPEWTVRDLVQHVLGGSQMAVTLTAGGTREEAIVALGASLDPADPVGAMEEVLAAQGDGFDRRDVLDQTLPHPAADLSGADVLGFRVTDLAVHGWDLARATGQDETMDPDVLEVVWAGVEPMVPMLPSLGIFGEGPSGEADEADLQTRVLDALGRRP